MEYQPPFFRDFVVDISGNPSDGHSESFALPPGMVPVAISAPSDLQSSVRATFMVADVDVADATGFEHIYGEDNALDHITLGTSRTLDVPATIRRGCLGRSFVRLVLMNGSNVAGDPSDDVTYRIYFADARGAS